MTKQIFKFILLLTFILIIPSIVSAQESVFKNSTPEERAHFQTEWMKSELSIDSIIVPVVYNINLKYSMKTQSVMNSNGSRIQKYRHFKDSSDAKDDELKKIFNKEQYKLYIQKKEQMKQKMKQMIQEKRKK
ncbi:MAG TPA: hypothetical protein VHO46_06945 [Bacteroidales bacterium]|nr:hypothetical protein [Bacteroidales bacterium]